MFNGEESIRIRTKHTEEKLKEVIDDVLGRIGRVEFFRRGDFAVSPGKFKSFATAVEMDGQLSKAKKEGEWTLRLEYNVAPSSTCWVIAVVGFLFCLFGPLVLIMPFLAKSEVQRAVERALRDVQQEVEDMGDPPFAAAAP